MFGAKNRTGYKSATPRTREGLRQGPGFEHNVYPGGKKLRKARARLLSRVGGTQVGKRPDRIATRDDGESLWGQYGFTKPGSLQA